MSCLTKKLQNADSRPVGSSHHTEHLNIGQLLNTCMNKVQYSLYIVLGFYYINKQTHIINIVIVSRSYTQT